MYTPSAPFPNGTTYMAFNDAWCCQCARYKMDAEGMPLPDNCEVEEQIILAQLDESKWPSEDIVFEKGKLNHICLKFVEG